MLETDIAVFFYTNKDFMSNFFPARIAVQGDDDDDDEGNKTLVFGTSEQYFMFLKAKCFGDKEIAAQIASNPAMKPSEAKTLGRRVKGFNEEQWKIHREGLMFKANLAKYKQSPELAAQLLATGDKTLAEASPRDRIWGIGMGIRDTNLQNPDAWRGTNLLGKALMAVRESLRE